MKPSTVSVLIVFAALGLFLLGILVLAVIPRPTEKPAQVSTLETPPYFAQEQIGTSVEGRSIEAYRYGTGPTQLLFVGGIHGGYEWNGAALAYKIIEYLRANQNVVPSDLTVTIIPDSNPDAVFKAIGKEGAFTVADVSLGKDLSETRFNAHSVDLNRNFDCKWQPESKWRDRTVSGGTNVFSEPESTALRDYIRKIKPVAVVLWHSQSNGVYASQCESGILPATLDLMETYARASGYPAVKTFDAYPTTGAAEDWLASIGIPAVSVELSTHDSLDWDQNLRGVLALFNFYSTQRGNI